MMKTKKVDVIVCGGGIAGLTTAILLANHGVRVACIDQRPFETSGTPHHDARTSALLQGSLNILRTTGAWEICKHNAEALWIMRIVDDSGSNKFSPVVTDFNAREMGDGSLPFGENIANAPLRQALIIKAQKHPEIDLLAPHSVTRIMVEASATSVFLDNKQILSAPLVIGADGRNSLCRKTAGISAHQWDYQQSAVVCLVEHSLPHQNVSTEFHRPTGPFTVVPMPSINGKNISSIVWSENRDQAVSILSMNKADFNAALTERSSERYGKMALIGDKRAYPLSGLHAHKYVAPRIALVAEAAHVLHPIGAQGLNLSLRDVATLCEVIIDAMRNGLDHGSMNILTEYEQRRRPDIQSRVFAIDGFNRIISNNYEILRTARRLGLSAIDKIPGLKSFVMKQGMDPALDSSRLLRGEVL